jgi:hypothetical protein
MAALSLSIDAIRPLNRWDHSRIQPGSVGSVGDVNLTPRLKHSSPNMPLRFDKSYSGKKERYLGSNVQNGSQKSFESGGGPARTIDSNWGGRRDFKTRQGYIFQDVRAPDTTDEPLLGCTPNYSYRNKVATTIEAKRTGANFLPLPHGYVPSSNQILRGGNFPRVTDEVAGVLSVGSSIVGQDEPFMKKMNRSKIGLGKG